MISQSIAQPVVVRSHRDLINKSIKQINFEDSNSWVRKAGYDSFVSPNGGSWTANLVGVASRAQVGSVFSIGNGGMVYFRFYASHSNLDIRLREGQTTNISNIISLTAGHNEGVLTTTQASATCGVFMLGGTGDTQSGFFIRDFYFEQI